MKTALLGESAGAGTALWIACSNNMADDSSPLIQFQQSTKVKAVAALETQSTYDMREWPDPVFSANPDVDLETIRDILTQKKLKSYYKASDLSTPSAIENAIDDYITNETDYLGNTGIELDILKLMKKNDPPFWVENKNRLVDFPTPLNDTGNSPQLNHHPYHAQALYNQANSVIPPVGASNLKVYANIPKLGIDNRTSMGHPDWEAVDFLIDVFS